MTQNTYPEIWFRQGDLMLVYPEGNADLFVNGVWHVVFNAHALLQKPWSKANYKFEAVLN